MSNNIDMKVVDDFGHEWQRFQNENDAGLQAIFAAYFSQFPWGKITKASVGFDAGCGSGRWAKFVAPKVGTLHCLDASGQALNVARKNLQNQLNCQFHQSSVDSMPFVDGSMDFGYSLGVLHHMPDTLGAIKSCAKKLKPGAPFLLYLYYRFDNKPRWYVYLWRVSDLLRRIISCLPKGIKYLLSQVIAALVYWPLAKTALLFEKMGKNIDSFPLAFYRNKKFYVLRNDALDRFGTRLEQRFTRKEITQMLQQAGFKTINFSEREPFWTVLAYR